jgi:hypothetical protein
MPYGQLVVVAFCLLLGVVGAWLYEKLLGAWITMRLNARIDAALRDLRSGKKLPRRKPTSPFRVAMDAGAVALADTRKADARTMMWREIARVTAFKRDRLVVDCVCILLADRHGRVLELDEEMAGWQELCDMLPTRLPGAKPFHEWFMQVAFPAFATNVVEIYRGDTLGPTE